MKLNKEIRDKLTKYQIKFGNIISVEGFNTRFDWFYDQLGEMLKLRFITVMVRLKCKKQTIKVPYQEPKSLFQYIKKQLGLKYKSKEIMIEHEVQKECIFPCKDYKIVEEELGEGFINFSEVW